MENKPSPAYYAAVVVINSDGQVLLGKRKEDGIWTTPGGTAEPGEMNPARTAVRELFEEAGIPANEAFLQPLKAIPTRNGKLCHVFLYVCGTSVIPTSKLDPDEEVGKWKFFSMDQIPNGLKEDERRFESVRNGYMKFYGITKSLTDNLEKGGKPAQIGEVRTFAGRQYRKMGDGSWVPVKTPSEQKLEQQESKKEVSPTQKLKDKVVEEKQISQSEKHLHDLKNQQVLEGKQTRSEKPVFTNVEAALAHGYKVEDYREVGNLFYDRATKMGDAIERLRATGQKVDPHYDDIKQHNLKIAKDFLKQANVIEQRQDKTKAMVKSTIAVGHADAAEIDTADYAIEAKNSIESVWLEKLVSLMEGFEFGEVPRMISLDKGDLYLAKVDDGIYSGIFKRITDTPEGQLEDNAKVRLERMTLPTLVQFCRAKEWISPLDVNPKIEPQQVEELSAKLEAPMEPPKVESTIDRKLEILRLLDKLTN